MEEILLFWGGDERGNLSSGPPHDFPYCIPVGSQAPQGRRRSLTPSSSERSRASRSARSATAPRPKGDVYEAMNFRRGAQAARGVRRQQQSVGHFRPAQAAIGVGKPWRRRRIAGGLHRRAGRWQRRHRHACGGRGGDRAGPRPAAGPRLIEALTYRLSDPHHGRRRPARYRPSEEVQTRWKEEPIARLRAYLVSQKGVGQGAGGRACGRVPEKDRGGDRALSGVLGARRPEDDVRSSLRRAAARLTPGQRAELSGDSDA